MALTEQQIKDLRVKYGITPQGESTQSGSENTETPDELIKRLRGGVPTSKENVLKTIAKDLAQPFVRAGVNAYNTVSGLGTLGAAGIAKVAGKDKMASELVAKAGQEADKVRNVPFFGEVKPVGVTDSLATNIKDIIGTGAQIGTTIFTGGESSAAKTGLRTAIKTGIKEFGKVGAVSGGLYEGGKALQDDASLLDTLQRTLVGTAAGGVGGAALGAAFPIVGAGFRAAKDATSSVVKGVRNQLPGSGEPTLMSGVYESAKSAVNKLKGSAERTKINVQAQQEARQAFEKLTPESQSAIRNGLLPRDVELVKAGNETEKAVFKKILKAAEDYSENRTGANRPSSVLGEEYRKRITSFGDVVNKEAKNLDNIVQSIKGTSLDTDTTINSVLTRMGQQKGLEGLNVTSDGLLDFSRTTLSGTNSKGARAEIQRIFNDVVQRADDPERLHLYRKELFEDLGGKKAGGIKLTGTEENAVNAMRQGMSDAIETVAPQSYKEANQKVATLLDLKKQLQKKFGEVAEGKEDIFDVNSSILLRRLTSNAKTGQDISALLQDLDGVLGNYGIKFDTNFVKMQEFVNLLDRYYDIAPDTSLLGIQRTALPGNKVDLMQKMIDIVGENMQVSDETAKFAIKQLLGEAGGQPKNLRNVIKK
jgi:hypothetical protein